MNFELLNDLALILIVAGIVSIIFKRLKQPLVLGYIVAGFLAGPHMPYTPTVDDMESIETWSQIGVIFMMFALGLEFSFKKILKMGFGPVVSAICIMFCMISIGSGVGWIFGWNSMNRLFLGGMLAMSSTTIIYKAFDDLGLRQKKFTKSVMSVLILEDILGILLMVILSAMAVSRQFEGTALVMSLVKLGFFLSLWFIVGIFIIPMFLKKNSRFINKETLLIFSLGLCFLLVILASQAGYSPAFGAFMMGSILAETVEAERIENAISSVKDFFGAIFFVSVGMLVDPNIIVEYWQPVLVIVVSIIIGQSIFGTISFMLSGQSLKDSMQSGFSMAQIGEFAFIIAALGVSLKVTDEFLYPVVVAVSIITTFLTPYMIKAALPAYDLVNRFMMPTLKKVDKKTKFTRINTLFGKAEKNNATIRNNEEEKLSSVWFSLLRQIVRQCAAYIIVSIAIITISFATLLPFFRSLFGDLAGNIVCIIICLLLLSPFLRPVMMRKNKSEEIKYISKHGMVQNILIWVLRVARFALVGAIVYYVISQLYSLWWLWNTLLSIGIVVCIIISKHIKYVSIRMERIFKHNLSRRERMVMDDGKPHYARRLRGYDLHIVQLTVPDNSVWGGKRLSQLQFGREDNVIIVAIIRGSLRINIPAGNAQIFPRDIIEVVGDDISIETFAKKMQTELSQEEYDSNPLHITRLTINSDSQFLGKTILESDIRHQLNCIVIGIENADGTLAIANANYVFKLGDIVWLVG